MNSNQMSSNQLNKKAVWEFWQAQESASAAELPEVIKAVTASNIKWFGPDPINALPDIESYIEDYWRPLNQAFPDLKRQTHIFIGGQSNGRVDGTDDGQEWVGATGYLSGTFANDWLDIPASGKKARIRWGEFCLIENGKIVTVYFLLDLIDLMQQAGIYVLPPALGKDHHYPPPKDGPAILLDAQNEIESARSLALIREFLFESLNSYDQSELQSMGVAQYFTQDVQWYGPGGIGACLGLKEFEELHQKPWLTAYPDRQVQDLDNLFAEGDYSGTSGWGAVKATHAGPYLGCPATGNTIVTNGIDFWRRRDDKFIENWVFVDMIHLFRQFGIDLMERMRSRAFHTRD